MPSPSPSELASLPLFESLSEPELAAVAVWFEMRDVRPGVRLISEGTTGYSLFVLLSGEAGVTAAGVDIASLGRGDFFGEMALLSSGGRRNATVRTSSAARVLVLFGTEFRRLQDRHPAIAAKIEAAMQTRLQQL